MGFDTETSGLFDFKKGIDDPSQPHIVSISAVLYDKNENLIDEVDVIVRPDGYEIDNTSKAVELHGITHEIAMEKGIPILEALAKVDALAQRAEFVVAHNISFDMAMVNREAIPRNIEMKLRTLPRLCTLKGSTNIVCIPSPRGYKWPKLSELHTYLFGEPHKNQHSSLSDIRATMRCYFELIRRKHNIVPMTKEPKEAAII